MSGSQKNKRDKDHHQIVFGLRRWVRLYEYNNMPKSRHDMLKILLEYQIATFKKHVKCPIWKGY